MKEKCYVLIEDNAFNFEDNRETRVFKTLKRANEELTKLKNEFLQENSNKGYVIDDCDEEEIKSFCAYIDGEYALDHYELTIYEKEIEE